MKITVMVDTLLYSLMMQELIGHLGMDDAEEKILNYCLTGVYAIDKRHNESFRYFMTGSPFEYDLIRKLYLLQREFLINN